LPRALLTTISQPKNDRLSGLPFHLTPDPAYPPGALAEGLSRTRARAASGVAVAAQATRPGVIGMGVPSREVDRHSNASRITM